MGSAAAVRVEPAGGGVMFLPTCKGCGIVLLPDPYVSVLDPKFAEALAARIRAHAPACSNKLRQGGAR